MQSPQRLTRGMSAAWLAIVVLTAYFIFIGGASSGFLFPHVRLFSVAIVAVVLAVWALTIRRDASLAPRSAIWPALLVGLVAFAISTLLSAIPRVSVEYLAFAVLLAVLYLLLVRIVALPALRVRVIGLAGGLAALISLLYIVLVVQHWMDWWAAVGRLAIPPLRPAFEGLVFSDPGGTAAITTMLASPAVAWLAVRGRSHRVAAVALAGLVGSVVVLTGARGAWLGVAVASVTVAIVAIANPQIRAPVRLVFGQISRAWIATILVALVLAIVVVGPTVVRRAVSGSGDDLRLTLAITGLRQFLAEPLDGGGPGIWVIHRAATTESDEVDYYIPHAHNIYAQTAAEFGIVGIVAAALICVVVGRLMLRSLRSRSAERRAIALSAVFVLTYFLVHQLVDMYVNVPAILFAAVLPVALLDGQAEEADMPRAPDLAPAARRLVGITLGAAAVASLIVITVISSRALPAIQIGTLANGHNWPAAAGVASQVAASDPDLPAHRFLHGLTAAREGDPGTAEQEMRSSAEADDFVFSWLNLAALELRRGDQDAARNSLERAMRLGWQQPAIALPAGVLYVELGDADAAVDAFAQALSIAPMLTDDPYWSTSGPEIAAAHSAAVEEALTRADPAKATVIALLAGDPERAHAEAARLEGPARTASELGIAAWEGDPEGRADLEELAESTPSLNTAVVWLGRLAARDGDLESVARYREWASITSGILGSDVGEDVVVTDEPIPGVQVPGANGNLQGWYVYVRQYPWDLVIPGLPKLTLE
jgi:tetratricopeptide (TPR) repeat protein